MFGLGWGEIAIIVVIATVLIGPKQLPEVIKGFSKFVRELTKAKEEWTQSLEKDESLQEIRKSVDDVKKSVKQPAQKFQQDFQKNIDSLKSETLGEYLEDDESSVDEKTEVHDGYTHDDEGNIVLPDSKDPKK